MRLDLATAPGTEPLTVAEAKAYRRIEGSTEDALVGDLITAARELFEEETGRQVITATWRLHLNRFPVGRAPIIVPKPPLQSVTSVTYLDADGASQTWDASEYTVVAPSGPFARPGVIYPKPGYTYPTSLVAANAVTVTFVAGYGAAATDVPDSLRSTLQAMVGDLYEQRETFLAGTIVTPNPALYRAMNRYRLPVMA